MRLIFLFFATTLSAFAADYDLLIRNARIADGTGSPLVSGSVAILGGRIAAVGEVTGSATTEIDARGLVVAPGFIDVHTHSEKIPSLPVAENFLRMGVTSIVTGNCGGSRIDIAKFFAELKAARVGINVATLIGHNSVRMQAMGGSSIRAPSPAEMETMKTLVGQAMKDGAVGMSTGLTYVPGSFSKTVEIIELAKVVATYDGIYASHIRYETQRIFTALDELTRIAREAGVRTELSHIKLSGPSAWGRATEVLAYLDKARADGLRITHDQYAYIASSTGLRQLLPDKDLEGTHADFVARLDDPARKAQIISGTKEILARSGRTDFTYAVIARFSPDPSLNGLTIPMAAKRVRGSDSVDEQIELLLDIERRGGGSGVFHGINEPDLQIFLRHPLTMIASDGGPQRLGEDVPHPRSYGNNARVLRRYVKELKILDLVDAIRRMTSLPAQTFGLKDRGVIKTGAWADVVVFDPDAVNDPSDFNDPHHYAEGFTHVIVNGVPIITDGKLMETRSGRALMRNEE